mmetsp:Transcript_27999/g.60769  ORF Transcript_27999/g.60769 Transcript_27999/m.60769 type:complete len:95 (+) Transcript_27999:688-972(+)
MYNVSRTVDHHHSQRQHHHHHHHQQPDRLVIVDEPEARPMEGGGTPGQKVTKEFEGAVETEPKDQVLAPGVSVGSRGATPAVDAPPMFPRPAIR